MTTATAADFLTTLHPGLADGGYIEARYLAEGVKADQRFYRTIDRLQHDAAKLQATRDCYIGISTRKGANGSAKGCVRATVVWADIDAKLFGDSSDAKAEAYRALLNFKVSPSIIIDSGGGWHPYWRLDQPLDLTIPENRQNLEEVNAGIARAVCGPGRKPDSVQDVARILRLPDTLNHKYDPPRPVRIVKFDPDQRYCLAELHEAVADFIPARIERESRPQSAAGQSTLSDAEAVTLLVGERGSKGSLLYQGRWEAAGYPDQSRGDEALCFKIAFYACGDGGQIDRIFRQSGLMRPKWDERHYADGTTYGQRTTEKALLHVTEHNTRPSSKPGTNGHGPAADDAGEDTAQEPETPPTWRTSDPVQPQSLADVVAVFERGLYLPSAHLVYVVLAVIAATFMPGDPLWLMLVGASSGGKTELLNSLIGIPHVRAAATITEASLLSGTSKKDKDKNAKGGLLRETGPFGILLLKDFTSILSMNRDQRAALLAALREIYDGSWTRNVGIDGGRTLSWEGKLGLLAGCTSAIDSAHAVMAAMGERFVLFRLPDIDAHQQARQALMNAGKERELRQALRDAVTGFFAGLHIPDEPPDLTDVETNRLIALAALVARSRSAVERDGQSREIELILDSEAPARIVQALRRLFSGLLIIGLGRVTAWQIVVKAGLDCIPKARHAAFRVLAERRDWVSTSAVSTAIAHPTATTKRALEDLTAHYVAERKSGGQGKADEWKLTEQAEEWYEAISLSASEMSESAKRGAGEDTAFNTHDTMCSDISDLLLEHLIARWISAGGTLELDNAGELVPTEPPDIGAAEVEAMLTALLDHEAAIIDLVRAAGGRMGGAR